MERGRCVSEEPRRAGRRQLPADLRLDEVHDRVGGCLHLVHLAHVIGDLAHQLFISTGFGLPTAGVVGIPSPELRHRFLLVV